MNIFSRSVCCAEAAFPFSGAHTPFHCAESLDPCARLLLQYYDDAAGILRSIILSAIAPHRLATAPPQLPMSAASLAKDDAMMLAERQATEEPNFLPYAAMDSIDEVDDRWTSRLSVLAGHHSKAIESRGDTPSLYLGTVACLWHINLQLSCRFLDCLLLH